MESLHEVGEEEMRLHSGELAIGRAGEVAEEDMALLVGVHGGIARVFIGQRLQREVTIITAIGLPEISMESTGIDGLEVQGKATGFLMVGHHVISTGIAE